MYTHVVTYVGNGKWQDSKFKVWARVPVPNTDIKDVRTYVDDMTHDAFLASRPDIAFMKEYNHMTVITVSDADRVDESVNAGESTAPQIEATDAVSVAPSKPAVEPTAAPETPTAVAPTVMESPTGAVPSIAL
jgi:hypothetical protein